MTHGLSILVVDDDRDGAEALADLLEIEGHDVTLAHDGITAVACFKERDFDITFMDVMMPGKNGVESFLEIKRARPGARVVMMTGYSVMQLLEQAIAEGAVGVLHKPFDPEDVLEHLNGLQEHHQTTARRLLLATEGSPQAKILSVFLQRQGIEVVQTHQTLNIPSMVAGDEFDGIVIDLELPIVDTISVTRDLRGSGYTSPIIVLAQDESKMAVVDEADNAEMPDLLFKPFDPEELLQRLRGLYGQDAR